VLAGGDRKVRLLQQWTLAPSEPYSQLPDVYAGRKRTIKWALCGGIKTTNDARPPNVEYVIGALCETYHSGAVVIGGCEIPQRLKEIRRKQKHEQTTG
jgi:hypothetical protein